MLTRAGWYHTRVSESACSVAISQSTDSVEDLSKNAACTTGDLVLW